MLVCRVWAWMAGLDEPDQQCVVLVPVAVEIGAAAGVEVIPGMVMRWAGTHPFLALAVAEFVLANGIAIGEAGGLDNYIEGLKADPFATGVQVFLDFVAIWLGSRGNRRRPGGGGVNAARSPHPMPRHPRRRHPAASSYPPARVRRPAGSRRAVGEARPRQGRTAAVPASTSAEAKMASRQARRRKQVKIHRGSRLRRGRTSSRWRPHRTRALP